LKQLHYLLHFICNPLPFQSNLPNTVYTHIVSNKSSLGEHKFLSKAFERFKKKKNHKRAK